MNIPVHCLWLSPDSFYSSRTRRSSSEKSLSVVDARLESLLRYVRKWKYNRKIVHSLSHFQRRKEGTGFRSNDVDQFLRCEMSFREKNFSNSIESLNFSSRHFPSSFSYRILPSIRIDRRNESFQFDVRSLSISNSTTSGNRVISNKYSPRTGNYLRDV